MQANATIRVRCSLDDHHDRTFCHRRRNGADRLPFGPPFLIAAGGGADRRSARTRTRRWINRAKRTTRHGRSTPPRAAYCLGRSETVHEATRRSPVNAMIQPSGPPRSHARVGMTLPRAANVGTGLKAERPGMCSVTAMRPAQNRAVPDTPRPKLLLSAISALAARGPFASHSTSDVAGCNGSGRRLTSVCAGQGLCGAPRRNRTGDPILTMDRRPSAVLTGVYAARVTP